MAELYIGRYFLGKNGRHSILIEECESAYQKQAKKEKDKRKLKTPTMPIFQKSRPLFLPSGFSDIDSDCINIMIMILRCPFTSKSALRENLIASGM